MAGSRTGPRMIRRLVAGLARLYFELSYGLLVGSSAGRRFLELGAFTDGPAVHGYLTADDLDVLLTTLRPTSRDRLLDLGSGIGGVALEIHRRSGAEIVGVDASTRAVAEATARARRAGAADAVRFVVGDLARPPRVGAASAYAIDSLMFVPDLAGALRGIGDALGSGGRLFATLLVVGSGAEARLRFSVRAAGAHVERLDDVTSALGRRSRARADAAVALRRRGTTSLRGRLAMRLVIAEEALIRALIANGRVSRWRFVVCYEPTPRTSAVCSPAHNPGDRSGRSPRGGDAMAGQGGTGRTGRLRVGDAAYSAGGGWATTVGA